MHLRFFQVPVHTVNVKTTHNKTFANKITLVKDKVG